MLTTFTDDVEINVKFPGLQYVGVNPPDAFIYYEDREVNGVMYRVENAQFQKSTLQWHQVDNTKNSYAIAQNKDGSISFLTKGIGHADWSNWDGWGQHSVFDVRDFGALGNGVNDDQAAINSAAAAASAAGGGVVYLPPGTYLISQGILLDNNTVLQGDFAGSSVNPGPSLIRAANGMKTKGAFSSIMVANTRYDEKHVGTTWQWNMAVRDLAFDNNAGGNPNGGDAAIFFQGVDGVSVERCKVYSCNSHAISVQSTLNTIPPPQPQGNVRILNNTIDVLPTRDPLNGTLLSGILSIRVWSLENVLIDGNIIGFNPPSTWNPTWSNDAIDTPSCSNTVVTNNMMTWCGDGIGTNTSGDVVVSGNLVSNFIGIGISSFASGGSGSSQFIVDANVIVAAQPSQHPINGYQTPQTGIRTLSPGSQAIVANNTLYGPFGSSAISLETPQGTCSGNVVDLNASAVGGPYAANGIKINANELVVTNNTIRNGQSSGTQAAINIVGPPTPANCVVSNNDIFNCQTNFLATSGLPTNSRISANLGINPYGGFGASNPAVPADGLVFTNPFPFDCMVYISGGSNLNVAIHGIPVNLGAGSYLVPVNETITLFYTSPPMWTWIAN